MFLFFSIPHFLPFALIHASGALNAEAILFAILRKQEALSYFEKGLLTFFSLCAWKNISVISYIVTALVNLVKLSLMRSWLLPYPLSCATIELCTHLLPKYLSESLQLFEYLSLLLDCERLEEAKFIFVTVNWTLLNLKTLLLKDQFT